MDLELHRLPGETFERKLGRTAPDEAAKTLRKGMLSYSAWLDSKGLKRIPRADWKPINGRKRFDSSWLNDQLRYGACVAASDAQALAKLLSLRGHSQVQLSWQYVYDQINGGRDNGACITDAAKVSEQGVPLIGDYDQVPQFNRNKQPQSRSRFRLLGWFTWSSWEDGCDIIQRGGVVQYPVQVGNRYNQFDSDGACGVDQGPGNHSVHSDGMDFRSNGEPLWDHMGSWGNWAFQGRAWHRQAHIESCAVEDDAFGHLWVADDPEESM